MTTYHSIIPRFYLSSAEGSKDVSFIQKEKIDIIVNCSKDIENSFDYIEYYRIPVDDNGNPKEIDNFYEYTIVLLDTIQKEYNDGKKILVHCLAGIRDPFLLYVLF